MIPQITSALSQGFTAKQVIDFLLRHFPSHGKQIQKAISSGYSAEQVLKYLAGGRKSLASDIPEMGTEHSRTRKMDIQRRQDVDKGFATAAGIGATGIGASLSAPMAAQALQRAAPQLLGPGSILPQGSSVIQSQLPQASPQTPPVMPNIQSSATQQPPVSPSIPNAPTPVQPEVKNINASEILNKYGLTKHVEEISKNFKDPKGVAAVLYNKFPKEMQRLQKEAGMPMEDVVAEYMANVKPLDIEKPEQPNSIAEIPKIEKFESEPIKIEKGSVAASPEGIGEIKAIRNGKAIIEIDGKKHQINEEDLETPLFSEDEIADAYEDLFKKIPEPERSGFISWAGYDEDKNVLGFIPRGGKYEELHNITPHEAQLIKEGKGVARTSGERTEGLWAIGEDTRGGIISQIIHDRRKKNEGIKKQQFEFSLDLPKPQKEDKGMNPIFDELKYARDLSRQREKKKRDEEKARFKKEKEDEKRKKRKK